MDEKPYVEIASPSPIQHIGEARIASPVLQPPIYPQNTNQTYEQGQQYTQIQPDHHVQHYHQPQNAYPQTMPAQQVYHSPPLASPQQHQQPLKSEAQATTTPVAGRIEYHTAVPIASLSMSPAPVDCPMCHQRRMTRITAVPGNTTHAWAGILFCFTIVFAFVPYMTKSTKDIQHNCGACGAHLATWHKSGNIEIFAYA